MCPRQQRLVQNAAMPRRLSLPLLLALVLPLAAQAESPKKPLAPVRAATAQLEASVQLWFEGKPAAEAFAPWQVVIRSQANEGTIPEQIRKVGGTALGLLAFELEVTLQDSAGKYVEVKTAVFTTPDEVGLLDLRAHDESRPDGAPIAAAPPTARPLARAASALGAQLASPSCKDLVIPDPASHWPGAAFLERASAASQRLREQLPELCAKLERPGMKATHFDVDDFTFLVRGEGGSYLGIFQREFELDDGQVVLELNHFELLPEPEAP